jgi:hypothetical protein
MNNTNRELLELAAKAAGIAYHSYFESEFYIWGLNIGEVDVPIWNPLIDDGDALRLAVKLHLKILLYPEATSVDGHWCGGGISTCERYGNDPYAATRRAIVRAAYEIGKDMI